MSIQANKDSLLFRVHLDGPLLLGLTTLVSIGLFVLYSASGQNEQVMVRQAIRIGVGVAAMLTLAQIPPRSIGRWSPWIYGLGVGLLILVLFFGTDVKGSNRWLDLGLFRFQPSEMMKLAVPLLTAAYLAQRPLPPNLLRIAISGLIVAVPVFLVLQQPDLGTSLLIVGSGLFVLFLAGIGWGYIASVAIAAIVSLPLLWYQMHDYQRTRIVTLLNPEQDPLGAGYHIIQSKIAVGSGGLAGKSWLHGTQSRLEFVPERSTDFIFAVFCEEFGFIGVLVLIAVYLWIILRGFSIAAQAQDTFSKLVAGSLTFAFFMYVFVNMGMVIGQLPVVGIPLPLISYGGTSLVTLMAGFGILMSIQTHRRLMSSP